MKTKMGERSSSRKKKTGQADKIRSSRWGGGDSDRTLLHHPNQLAELGSERRRMENRNRNRTKMFGVWNIRNRESGQVKVE